MADPETDAPQPGDAASVGRGLLAGLAGTLLGIPLLVIGFVVAEFLKRMLLSKLLGYEVEWEWMEHGSEAFFASIILATATGAIGGGGAAAIAVKLLPNAARRPFLTVMGIGMAAVLAAFGLWLKARLAIGTGTLIFSLLLAWAGAFAGMAAVTMDDEEETDASAAEVPAAG